jgi:hypothetical protein
LLNMVRFCTPFALGASSGTILYNQTTLLQAQRNKRNKLLLEQSS